MDVSEARRGQGLEIDHKEIARRKTQALLTPAERADYHLATPLLATPGEALGERIDLIVVATGKRERNIRFADRSEVGLTAMASGVLADARTGKNGRHALAGLFGSLAKRNLTHAESRHHHWKHAAGPKGGGRRALGL
jgi:hypothetical protein